MLIHICARYQIFSFICFKILQCGHSSKILLILPFYYIKVKSLSIHSLKYLGGIQLLKHNLFYPGVCDLAKIESLYERSSNLKQVFEGIRVKWITSQKEGAAGVKTRSQKTKIWVLVWDKEAGNGRIYRYLCLQKCGQAAVKWLMLATLTTIFFLFFSFFFFATSDFSFSCYWEQFHIVYVHVYMGTIRMWLVWVSPK